MLTESLGVISPLRSRPAFMQAFCDIDPVWLIHPVTVDTLAQLQCASRSQVLDSSS